MLEEEGAVIVGLLVGLNVIDANLCVKGEDLDTQVWGILLDLFSSTRGHIVSNLMIHVDFIVLRCFGLVWLGFLKPWLLSQSHFILCVEVKMLYVKGKIISQVK